MWDRPIRPSVRCPMKITLKSVKWDNIHGDSSTNKEGQHYWTAAPALSRQNGVKLRMAKNVLWNRGLWLALKEPLCGQIYSWNRADPILE